MRKVLLATLKHTALLGAIAIMACSLTGCALMIPLSMEKKGVKTTPETRRTDLDKKEIKLTVTPVSMSDGLNFRLQYQPYYQERQRSITTYRWKLDDSLSYAIRSLGILEVLCGLMALFPDQLDRDDPDSKFREFFKKNQKPILIGIASDFVFSSLSFHNYGGTKTKSTNWKTLPARLDDPINIRNHPVSVSLPQFDKGTTYRTDSNGSITIPTNDLIDMINEVSKISDLNSALKAKSIKIDASAKFDGEKAEESFSIYEWSSRQLFQALDKRAKRLRAEP